MPHRVLADREEGRLGAMRRERGQHRRRVVRPRAVIEGQHDLAWRRKSWVLKCSKPKPGPPVVSSSTTRDDAERIRIAGTGLARNRRRRRRRRQQRLPWQRRWLQAIAVAGPGAAVPAQAGSPFAAAARPLQAQMHSTAAAAGAGARDGRCGRPAFASAARQEWARATQPGRRTAIGRPTIRRVVGRSVAVSAGADACRRPCGAARNSTSPFARGRRRTPQATPRWQVRTQPLQYAWLPPTATSYHPSLPTNIREAISARESSGSMCRLHASSRCDAMVQNGRARPAVRPERAALWPRRPRARPRAPPHWRRWRRAPTRP